MSPTPYSSAVFTFDSHLNLSKSLGASIKMSGMWILELQTTWLIMEDGLDTQRI
jgi:hypothetical protein